MARSTVKAGEIISGWKGDNYAYGIDVTGKTGEYAKSYGGKALLVVTGLGHGWVDDLLGKVESSLKDAGVTYSIILGSRPNSPREDIYRIANEISKTAPDSIVAIGGGSTIDAVKASSVLAAYSTEEVMKHLGADVTSSSGIEPFLGMGLVSKMVDGTGKEIVPVIAVETVSSSAAHLTKYSNITDPLTGQKKLIIDMGIVPPKAVFDYGVTLKCPKELTLDGGLDGISHLWEVFMGASGKDFYDTVKDTAVEGISLIVENLPVSMDDPDNLDARVALGYGTDLGGHAIMVGGTNGGHLGSFSLVDVLAHGRACAVLNPYYTVLFAPAIQDQLRTVGAIFKEYGSIGDDLDSFEGRELGEAVARGMIAFSKSIGFPTTLKEAGATEAHIDRMIGAAKNPQLESKLKNMPTPMDSAAGDVDTYMRPVLNAAFTGDFSLIKTMS